MLSKRFLFFFTTHPNSCEYPLINYLSEEHEKSKPRRSRQRKNPLVSQNISHSGPVPYEEEYACQLCDKSFSCKFNLKLHKKSIRHQKLKNKLKQDQEKRDVDILVGGEISSDFDMTANISGDFTQNMANSGVQFHCNICDVFCTDQEAFMNHMSAYHEENKPFATRLINTKGQLIAKGNFAVFKSTKKTNDFF